MSPSHIEVGAIKDALSACKCSATTVAALQKLLDEPATGKTPATARKTTARTTAKTPAKTPARTSRTPARQTGLSPQEKLTLATEVVNISLKALSDAPKTARRRSLDKTYKDKCTGPAAVVECARLAFSYLGSQRDRDVGMQLENGMLVLAGKCVAHGLDVLALKELRSLRRRLCQHLGEDLKAEATADIMAFPDIPTDSPVLPLAASLQLTFLKAIALQRRASVVESCLEHLQPDTPSSPIALLLRQANSPSAKAKAARQLESLSQTLFSLCPSVAPADDTPTTFSPAAAFKLQYLAFQARLRWWKLAGHEANIEKEFWNPLSKCLSAFSRRAKGPADDKYRLVNETVRALEAEVRDSTPPAILKILSSLAHAAGSPDAIRWTEMLQTAQIQSGVSEAQLAASTIRIATLALGGDNGAAELRTALDCLSGKARGDSADLDALVVEVAGLRRAAVKVYARERAAGGALCKLSQDTVFACVHFLTRYIGSGDARRSDRLLIVSKIAKGAIDSVLLCCRQAEWEVLDAGLQDCHFLAKELVQWADGPDGAEIEDDIRHTAAKVSNLYWLSHQRATKPDLALLALRKSVAVLKEEPAAERQAAHLCAKLERLAEISQTPKTLGLVTDALRQVVDEHIQSGTLRAAADQAAALPLDAGRMLKSVRSLALLLWKRDEPHFDDSTLPDDHRGLLLEWQFEYALPELIKARPEQVPARAESLFVALMDVYAADRFPVRRLRTVVTALRLPEGSVQLGKCLLELDARWTKPAKDKGLVRFWDHLSASARALRALRNPVDITAAQKALETWQGIVDSSVSLDSLQQHVDPIEPWVAQLNLLADFFAMQGAAHSELRTLNLLVKVLELQEHSALPGVITRLGLQYSRAGFTTKAGVLLARAQALLTEPSEARLRWCLAYAEYLLDIGCLDKAGAALEAAEQTAVEADIVGSKTRSTRTRTIQLVSEACYVYSRHALETGAADDAFRLARACVKLNQRAWANIEGHQRRASPGSGSESEAVVSMTHDALQGAAFWAFVPALFRGLAHLAAMFAHNGLFQEAIYYAEQAKRVADAGGIALRAANMVDALRIRGGEGQKAWGERIDGREEDEIERDTCDAVGKYLNAALVARDLRDWERVNNELDAALRIIDAAPGLERVDLADQVAALTIDKPNGRTTRKAPTKATKVTKVTKAIKVAPRKPEECSRLLALRARILRGKANALLELGQIDAAHDLLQHVAPPFDRETAVQQQIAQSRHLARKALKELASDFTYSTLLESTISVPALATDTRRGRAAKFAATLRAARECVGSTTALSTTTLRDACRSASSASILLSAAGPVHPLAIAPLLDLPRIHASQRELAVVRIEEEKRSSADLLKWPSAGEVPTADAPFQEQYIDIIPPVWTAVSLSLNEARDELVATRYRAGQSPFVLRLPMVRHNSRDPDEELFDFCAGKAELTEIIELSNFSTRNARDMSAKGARGEWWAAREALDTRLAELLTSIENFWLGGFRGIFGARPNAHALGRFQKTFQDILHRNLPRKGKAARPVFDPRILELFVALGTEDDEPLMDLLYFVVDIMQFSGDRFAYDEVDFDAIAIATIDAIRDYHDAAPPPEAHHTILILDKDLHAFPWESLPSLRGLSISRLPSLAALRERIIAAAPPTPRRGASILNPSGDLLQTQKTLQPYLRGLGREWAHQTAPPSESELAHLAADNDLLLYFGHGSGAQFARPRAIRKLGRCATTWLMGCSSAAVTEHGEFEPSGMVLAYLAAGAPAVVGTLWDVTDRDCDRAAIRLGEVWGLWDGTETGKSLVEAVVQSRDACYLRHLNGAAFVVYGVPVYLG
ncbi:hypothetical protein EJ06DRAFT_495058 [Trichodelitschia bisporula]|uniref:separase n=1 Tax=Trichodelitschia bisporula TaxID=703511 RepID=A0A6G1HUD0_9PEZI|nr:hypothetical protein EJ06DRAFT_495058 [Trichodelitschia bisporula]